MLPGPHEGIGRCSVRHANVKPRPYHGENQRGYDTGRYIGAGVPWGLWRGHGFSGALANEQCRYALLSGFLQLAFCGGFSPILPCIDTGKWRRKTPVTPLRYAVFWIISPRQYTQAMPVKPVSRLAFATRKRFRVKETFCGQILILHDVQLFLSQSVLG